MSYNQLSNVDELISRIVELNQSGLNLHQVADRLNKEGFRSLRDCPFTNGILSRLLVKRGIHVPRGKRGNSDQLEDHEWWLVDIADQIGMPRTTLNNWVRQGYVTARKLPGPRGRLIIWADENELNRLKQLRNERRRWSDQPYPTSLTTPKQPPVGK